ncbi:MAG: mechanosensitive ion channel [Myxococcota bacterium]|jgi:small-conductance mechanosensitive channel|nr:mechanosensitive ion channel [Myxococcota bacterium]
MEEISTILNKISEISWISLLTIGERDVTVGTLVVALVILVVGYVLARLLTRVVDRGLVKKGSDHATRSIIVRLLRYIVLLVGIVAALETIGIHLSTLFAAGAIFAVGLGFAMQNIVQNFVSGVILLVERSIKPGDVLEVDGHVVKVSELGIRFTQARTRNDEELIIPNSVLVQGTVKNYTASDTCFLLETTVGVAYSSDLKVVRAALEEVAGTRSWKQPDKDPRVLLREFGDCAVLYSVYVPITDPWPARLLQSELNEAIWWAFKKDGITIAFPQLDVHFDEGLGQRVAPRSGKSE